MRIEVVKWLGFVAMLIDHVGVYVVGGVHPWTEVIGALALPLFAFAIGDGLARAPLKRSFDVGLRTLGYACVAQLGVWLVRDGMQLNVLFTIGLGVLLYDAFLNGGSRSVLSVAAVVWLGWACEFSYVGVVLVAASCWWFRRGSFAAWAVGSCALGALVLYNGSHAAVFAIAIAASTVLVEEDLPRVRHVFYVLYCAQFPLLLLARVVGRGFGA